MTSQEDKHLYSDLSLHADTVESSLQGGLVEGTVTERWDGVLMMMMMMMRGVDDDD